MTNNIFGIQWFEISLRVIFRHFLIWFPLHVDFEYIFSIVQVIVFKLQEIFLHIFYMHNCFAYLVDIHIRLKIHLHIIYAFDFGTTLGDVQESYTV